MRKTHITTGHGKRNRGTRIAFATVLMAMLGFFGFGQTSAWAASDQIDKLDIAYTVSPSGVVHVEQTMVYRFGQTGGHGILHSIVTREPYDDEQDAVFDISNIKVTSPDAPSKFSQATDDSGREQFLELKIGDPNITLNQPTATYTISYDLRGALRSSGSYDEFYWDAVGDIGAPASNISIAVTVPGGVQEVTCNVGPVKSQNPCAQSNVDGAGVAHFAAASKPSGDIMTISTKIGAGLVEQNTPILAPKYDNSPFSGMPVGAVGGATAGAALLGAFGAHRQIKNGRDLRFAGEAPGSIPVDWQHAATTVDDIKDIPVSFEPPKIPVGWTGRLLTGAHQNSDTTATILSLATHGAVGLRTDPADSKNLFIRLNDRRKAADDIERAVFDELAPYRDRMTGEVALNDPQMMEGIDSGVSTRVRRQTLETGIFTSAGSGSRYTYHFGLLAVIGALAVIAMSGTGGWWWFIPIVPLGIAALVAASANSKGKRSPVGRAYTDQVEGFKKYIATAEADQLRFEEGRDIFSEYLPWAVAFGLAERWTKVCGDLIAMGRLSSAQPTWYYGNDFMWDYYLFNSMFDSLDNSVSTAGFEPVDLSSSGTGFGGGSSFDFGGFSGGGFGGGGTSSW